MRIVQFEENQKEIWNRFIAKNNSESFLQSWGWGNFQKSAGKKIWRLGIFEENDLFLTALILKNNLPFGKSYLYCPKGPVTNESKDYKVKKSKVLELLLNEIRKIAKKEKSLFLRIDPPMDWNMEYGIWNMEDKGFRKSFSEIQPKDTLILDLEKSEDELLKEMKQKTRYNIRLAEKKGVKIINIRHQASGAKHFEKFWKLTEETSKRDNFSSHNKNYYYKMLQNLSNSEGGILKHNLQARLYSAEYEDKIIAANIVLFFGDICVYLHGASSNEHRNVMAPYLLQWRQIKDAKKTGCKKYDFWGIENNSKFNNWGGITRFKKGFGGYEKSYIGTHDLVLNNIGYCMYEFIKKFKIYF